MLAQELTLDNPYDGLRDYLRIFREKSRDPDNLELPQRSGNS